MVLTIEVKYEVGQIVYLKTDPEQSPRIVYGYYFDNKGIDILYRLASGINTSQHYDFEITEEKDVLV